MLLPERHGRARPGHPRRAEALSCQTRGSCPTWIPGTSPGMTIFLGAIGQESPPRLGRRAAICQAILAFPPLLPYKPTLTSAAGAARERRRACLVAEDRNLEPR